MDTVERMAESKFKDDFINFDAVAGDGRIYADGIITDTCNISDGVGVSERIGNQITATSLQVRYCVGTMDTAGDRLVTIQPNFILRCIIFSWLSDDTPTADSILEANDAYTDYFSSVLSPLNHDKKVKRKILYDKTTTHYATVVSDIGACMWNGTQYIDIYLPIKKYRKVEYQLATAINRVYIMMISNVSLAAPGGFEPWPVYMYYRLNYKDI